MKTWQLLCAFVFVMSAARGSETPQLVRWWETEPVLERPTAILFDPAQRVLFVSNTGLKELRDPWAKDGRGSISKVGLDGTILAAKWITGLDSPRDLAIHDDRLYVSDVDCVRVIDMGRSSVAKTIAVPGAKALAGIAIDRRGVIYASDVLGGKIYAITSGKPSVFAGRLIVPSGLAVCDDALYVAGNSRLFRFRPDGTQTRVRDGLHGGVGGIGRVNDHVLFVTAEQGVLHWIDVFTSETQVVLDTRAERVQAADVAYDPTTRAVFIPTLFHRTVVAYRLE